jgi:subtilisin family serine protease
MTQQLRFDLAHRLMRGIAVSLVALVVLSAPVAAGDHGGGAGNRGRDLKDLRDKAARQGSVPLIVELNVGAPPSAESVETHRSASAHARAALHKELGGGQLPGWTDAGDLPFVTFHGNERQLERLERSSLVRSVREDLELAIGIEEQELASVPVHTTSVPSAEIATADGAETAGTSSRGASQADQLPAWWDYYRIGTDRARAAGWTGSGQTVAVIDMGVERTHSWLSGDVVVEACFATRTLGASGGDCPNGAATQYGTGSARPCPWTGCDHGTHVAHTAAGYWGIGSGANIIALQTFHWTSQGPRTWESDYIKALAYVYSLRNSYRIAAVNMSIGGSGWTGYCDNTAGDDSTLSNPTYLTGWINALSAANIATVISSGNNDYYNALGHPSCISGAISVGNTTLDASGYEAVLGYTTYGSNSNSTLDLLAPGTDICSAVPGNGVDCTKYGTSMAAPHVAGAIAVLKQFRPSATVAQVLSALQRSGVGIYDSRNGVTVTRIDVYRALSYI